MKALSVAEVLRQNKEIYPFKGAWADAFAQPERTGVWFVWGNSGNGKTSFVMQLCKELCKYERVIYNSLEEGDCLTMQNTLIREAMHECGNRFQLLPAETMKDLKKRLSRRNSPKVVVIDSFQYTHMNFADYLQLRTVFKDKLFIFTSQATGRNPSGEPALKAMYDAGLKIWIEGFRAYSKGRTIGKKGYYTIWEEGERKYYGIGNEE